MNLIRVPFFGLLEGIYKGFNRVSKKDKVSSLNFRSPKTLPKRDPNLDTYPYEL